MRIVFLWFTLHPYFVPRLAALARVNDVILMEYFHRIKRYPAETIREGIGFKSLILDDINKFARCECLLVGRVINHLKQEAPDVLVIPGYTDPVSLMAAFWAKKHGISVIMWFASTYDDHQRNFLGETAKFFLLKGVDGIAVPGRRHRDYAIRLGAKPSCLGIIGNGVDNSFFREAANQARNDALELRRQLDLPERYFLYVGVLTPEKNLSRTLRAYAQYCKENPGSPWGFILVGAGPQEATLKRLSHECQLDGVKFLGFRTGKELGFIYGLASALILPSVSETWGLVVNEGMAAGLPILASKRCGCVSELLRSGENGLVFDPLRPDEISRAMHLVASDEEKRRNMGEASRRLIASMDHETWASGLMELIGCCCRKK